MSACSSPGVTNPPAWESPARPASPNRSGWTAIRFILVRTGVVPLYVGSGVLDLDPGSGPSGSCFLFPFRIGCEGAAGGPMDTMPMDTMTNETRLPIDIDAQPLVQAAAALQPVLRKYHDEIEREQRMPPALFEQ